MNGRPIIKVTVALMVAMHMAPLMVMSTIYDKLECYCDVDDGQCNMTSNSCFPRGGICRVDFDRRTSETRRYCNPPLSSCHSDDLVISNCCSAFDRGCNKCLPPKYLSYEECTTLLMMSSNCPPLSCSHLAREPPLQMEIIIPSTVFPLLLVIIGGSLLYLCVRNKSLGSKLAGSSRLLSPDHRSMRFSSFCQEICLKEQLGPGSNRTVWRGTRFGQDYVVKVYRDNEVNTGIKEAKIISSLNHPNIINWIFMDHVLTETCQEFRFIIEYHDLGSLTNFITDRPISKTVMFRMLQSMTSALEYLHHPPHSSDCHYIHRKISHRDIKSDNLLVKNLSGGCILTDFGLSVTEEDFGDKIVEIQRGTNRFMAPELLANDIPQTIDAFCLTDIYSLGIVFFEVLQRVELNSLVPPYTRPFSNFLPQNPSLDEVKAVVVEQNIRPQLGEHWNTSDEVCLDLVQLMKACWTSSPNARPSATYIAVKLDALRSTWAGVADRVRT